MIGNTARLTMLPPQHPDIYAAVCARSMSSGQTSAKTMAFTVAGRVARQSAWGG
jgi:hypothetical protein